MTAVDEMTQKTTQNDPGSTQHDDENPNSHENDDDETSSFTKHLIDTFVAMSASPDVTPVLAPAVDSRVGRRPGRRFGSSCSTRPATRASRRSACDRYARLFRNVNRAQTRRIRSTSGSRHYRSSATRRDARRRGFRGRAGNCASLQTERRGAARAGVGDGHREGRSGTVHPTTDHTKRSRRGDAPFLRLRVRDRDAPAAHGAPARVANRTVAATRKGLKNQLKTFWGRNVAGVSALGGFSGSFGALANGTASA